MNLLRGVHESISLHLMANQLYDGKHLPSTLDTTKDEKVQGLCSPRRELAEV